MVINITVSVVCIKLFGICGAILGTIVALIYRGIVMINFANRDILGISAFTTYKKLIINGSIFAFMMMIFFVDTFSNMSFGRLVLNGIIHSVWIVALYVLVNFMFYKNILKTLIEFWKGNKE